MMHSRLLVGAIAAISMVSRLAAEPPHTDATCIAIALPSVQGVEGSATEVGNAVRDLFASYLTGPSIRTITLEARLPSQAVAEARQKDCGQILLATLIRKHSGGILGKALGQGAGAAAWYVPGGASVGSAVARGAAIGSAQAAATIAASTRAKDEVRLEYTVSSADAAGAGAPRIEKAKAQVDREDLLTPLVERAATTIVTAITGK